MSNVLKPRSVNSLAAPPPEIPDPTTSASYTTSSCIFFFIHLLSFFPFVPVCNCPILQNTSKNQPLDDSMWRLVHVPPASSSPPGQYTPKVCCLECCGLRG